MRWRSDVGSGAVLGLAPGDRRLPAPLAARALAYERDGGQPVVPRVAATVALLRDGVTGVEAYLLRRVTTMAFAAGMHVFPGGGVDVRDAQAATLRWAGPPPEEWAVRLGTDAATAQGLVCAAVRETFEESGVLLAGPDAKSVVSDTTDDEWEADRLALIAHDLAFADVLDRRDLVLRTDLLRAWSRWVTPEFEPRRYDTFFFLAALPGSQRTRHVGGEADRVAWLRPGDAVGAFRAGKLPMLPPTIATLLGVAAAGNVRAALALADSQPIDAITPRASLVDGRAFLVLPGEDGYDR